VCSWPTKSSPSMPLGGNTFRLVFRGFCYIGIGGRLACDKTWREARLSAIEVDALKEDAMAMEVQIDGPPPRSPNGAACPLPKPRRASRRRLAASAGCARRPPLSAGELGETSVGGAGATGWVGASGGKGRSRAAVPPAQPQPRWRPGLRPGRARRRGPAGGGKGRLNFLYSQVETRAEMTASQGRCGKHLTPHA
jgi:hypothetical protein